MLIGIDFDNTIVCYDRLFHALALERGLISQYLPATKTSVRNYLIEQGREEAWTELQGLAYGPEIGRAELFPGVLEFFREAHRREWRVAIISHKTRHPFRGEKHDLHAAARGFLQDKGFFAQATGLTESNVFFELTKADKLARIATHGCTHFIDDLPDLLSEPAFPEKVWKILFDPGKICAHAAHRLRINHWREAFLVVACSAQASLMIDSDEAAPVLRAASFSPEDCTFTLLTGGRNNRTFLLEASDGRRAFLKWYFRHREDLRDRLGAEFAFASYCRTFCIDAAPQPLARDDAAGLAIYEFVPGSRLAAGSIDQDHIAQAAAFVRELQYGRDSPEAANLPTASEACFSVDQHRVCIGGRITRLAAAARERSDEVAFQEFVFNRLVPAWHAVERRLLAAIAADPETYATPLSPAERCLSPSDFGFHNAIEQPDGRLRFFDFEYAGWDDPAKLVCDFFCQVQVPAPLGFAPWFTEQMAAAVTDPARFKARTELLFPAYQVKWCAIVLNDFLPDGAARRAFGMWVGPSRARLDLQLAKAARILDRVTIADE